MSDHFVRLQIPTLDHLVLCTREQLRMPWRDGQPANSGDVTGKGEFERAGSEVPDLDRTIAGSGSEPLVTRLHGEGADPAEVAGDDAEELPGRTPLRFLLADCVAANQASRRCVALRRRSVGVGWEFSTSCALYAGQGCRCAVCLYLLSGSRCACVLDHLGHLRVARCSSVFGFFFRAARPACAFACFAASAAGNSRTSACSLRIRAATLALCARSYGDGSEGATSGCGGFCSADGRPNSAAKTSRVRFADRRTASAARAVISGGISEGAGPVVVAGAISAILFSATRLP